MGHLRRGCSGLLCALALCVVATLSSAAAAWAIAPPVTFGYTGGQQTYTVPSGVVAVGVGVQGAWGGQNNNVGQNGEGITGYLMVTPGQSLFAEVGQNGSYHGGATFGGGGASGKPPPVLAGGTDDYASSGGGASDVRSCSLTATSCAGGGTSLGSRLIVAAGGGGYGGGGNAAAPTCSGPDGPGSADNHQTNLPSALPGGPPPVLTAAGIVIPGFASDQHSTVMDIGGTIDAAFGSSTAGAGGVLAGCSSGSLTFSDSVAGGSGWDRAAAPAATLAACRRSAAWAALGRSARTPARAAAAAVATSAAGAVRPATTSAWPARAAPATQPARARVAPAARASPPPRCCSRGPPVCSRTSARCSSGSSQ